MIASGTRATHMGCDVHESYVLDLSLLGHSRHPHGVRLYGFDEDAPNKTGTRATHMGCDALERNVSGLSAMTGTRATHMGCDCSHQTPPARG